MSHLKTYHFTSNHASSKKNAISKFDILLSEINDDNDSTIRTNLKCGGDWQTIIVVCQDQLSVWQQARSLVQTAFSVMSYDANAPRSTKKLPHCHQLQHIWPQIMSHHSIHFEKDFKDNHSYAWKWCWKWWRCKHNTKKGGWHVEGIGTQLLLSVRSNCLWDNEPDVMYRRPFLSCHPNANVLKHNAQKRFHMWQRLAHNYYFVSEASVCGTTSPR